MLKLSEDYRLQWFFYCRFYHFLKKIKKTNFFGLGNGRFCDYDFYEHFLIVGMPRTFRFASICLIDDFAFLYLMSCCTDSTSRSTHKYHPMTPTSG